MVVQLGVMHSGISQSISSNQYGGGLLFTTWMRFFFFGRRMVLVVRAFTASPSCRSEHYFIQPEATSTREPERGWPSVWTVAGNTKRSRGPDCPKWDLCWEANILSEDAGYVREANPTTIINRMIYLVIVIVL